VTAIERTAYPRLHRNPTERDLAAIYTPTEAELAWVPTIARDAAHRLHLLLWLKCFQCLGYFPDLLAIPTPISDHLRTWLPRDADVPLGYGHDRMRYRHQQAVRDYLGVQAYDEAARTAISTTLRTTAQVMDNPADLINVALEELVRLRYELPAFSALDHLVENIRTEVNQTIFTQVAARLTADETTALQALLDTKLPTRRTPFQALKDPAKNAPLGHLRELEHKLAWLLTLAAADRLLSGVPPAKIQHFAAQAHALDAGAMNDINPPRRYTLLLCGAGPDHWASPRVEAGTIEGSSTGPTGHGDYVESRIAANAAAAWFA